MKRFVLTTCMALTVLAAGQARGGIDVLWSAASGFIPLGGDGGTGILNGAINPGGEALAQLIFTPLDSIDAASQTGPDFTSGDDAVLDSIVLNSGTSSEYADFSAPNYQDLIFTPGWIYVRVFESTAPTIGSFYYDSVTVELQDITPGLGFPQTLDVNRDSLGVGLGDELNLQVVPEPGTMALCLVGLGALGLRRRRTAA